MSAGLEIRGNSLRIWINDGSRIMKETLAWKKTPENIEKAEKLAKLIQLELEMGTFDLIRHFPNSKYVEKNSISYYANIWKLNTEKEVSPSTFYSYRFQVDLHVLPRWGKIHPKDIDTTEIKNWIRKLKQKLQPKTIREIVTRLSQIHAVWRNEHRITYNPFVNISIQQEETPEPDPFSKAEINQLLNTTAYTDIANLLPCLLWTGLSISEQLALAWEDIDLHNGTVLIQRGWVRNNYRVTKTRRRKRQIKLLQPAIQALKLQYQLTGQYKAQIINVMQRDNHTFKKEKVRFVWINHETMYHYKYSELRYRWNQHLKKSKVRHRGINQGRHTFASQLLSSGQVPPEWIADQLGHTDTTMIYKHYGKIIAEDAPDYISKINSYIDK
ncbi:tyrosine-type recombinase/integrase [Acinetobacter qingfengensis]|uniref:Integrase n=1 Tax=Acinetobacter qingfengensis TaxID=1262585 RepID=A0A1E7RC96_9GAMM|nr:tyrosine-type recombinase/integrase [Acinetobacter qingfengensis]KAA8734879.1 tyrosine-type recombinase/integrase [Acinetobacter qingfengensis]OEY96951.1 integrase [Acinetobacter qingfengensis]